MIQLIGPEWQLVKRMLVRIGNGTPLTEPKVNKDNDTRLRHNHRTGQNRCKLLLRVVGSQSVKRAIDTEREYSWFSVS